MGVSGGAHKCVRSRGRSWNRPAEAITQQAAASAVATCWELSTLSVPSLPKRVQAPRDSEEVRWAHAAVEDVSALKEW